MPATSFCELFAAKLQSALSSHIPLELRLVLWSLGDILVHARFFVSFSRPSTIFSFLQIVQLQVASGQVYLFCNPAFAGVDECFCQQIFVLVLTALTKSVAWRLQQTAFSFDSLFARCNGCAADFQLFQLWFSLFPTISEKANPKQKNEQKPQLVG